MFKALNMQPKIKVVVAFYQIIVTLDQTYSVTVPQSFTRWMDVFRFVGIDW